MSGTKTSEERVHREHEILRFRLPALVVAINKDAAAKITCLAPDVCLTPMGSIMVPVPYKITAHFNVTEDTAPKVNYGGPVACRNAIRTARPRAQLAIRINP
jgi:hypothetical protein